MTLGVRHSFRDETLLSLIQNMPKVTYNTTRLCWFYISAWKYHIDAVSVWSWNLLVYFHFSAGDKPSFIRYAEVEWAIKPQYLTSKGSWLVDQLFCRTLCFSGFDWYAQFIFSSKENGLVALFNGIFNAKAILLGEQQWCYLTYNWEDKEVHTFPKSICLKVNI